MDLGNADSDEIIQTTCWLLGFLEILLCPRDKKIRNQSDPAHFYR